LWFEVLTHVCAGSGCCSHQYLSTSLKETAYELRSAVKPLWIRVPVQRTIAEISRFSQCLIGQQGVERICNICRSTVRNYDSAEVLLFRTEAP
jgi:hypothetical protein